MSRETPMPKKNGFTLIEILLAGSIFMVVMIIGVASFSKSLGIQFKTAQIGETNINARFPIETLAREIRMASNLTVLNNGVAVTSPTNGRYEGNQLTITLNGQDKTYFVDTNGLLKVKDASNNPISVTSGNINVSNLQFDAYVPVAGSSIIAPHVTIQMTVSNTKELNQFILGQASIPLQTTVVLRNFSKY